jgi:hypothetical protein
MNTMKKGKNMQITRTLIVSACLAGAALAPATAHHQDAANREHLAFWRGHQAPAFPSLEAASCTDGAFWEKGFVSIYSQTPASGSGVR